MIKHKGFIVALLCVNALLTLILIFTSIQSRPTKAIIPPEPEPLTDISNDLLLATLQHQAELVIAGHYKNMNGYGVNTSPLGMEVIQLKRLGDGRSFTFEVVLKVTPYSGANIPVGEDNITFEINNGFVRVKSFEHIKDFPVADYQNPQ